MSKPERFAKSIDDIARELGLSVQQVRWAEQSAIKKLKESELATIDVDQFTYDNHRLLLSTPDSE